MPAIENSHSRLDQLWSGGRYYRVGKVRRQQRRVLTVPGSEGCANPSFSDIVRSVTDLALHEELGQGNSRAAHACSRRRFAHAQYVDDPLTQGQIATLTHVGIAESRVGQGGHGTRAQPRAAEIQPEAIEPPPRLERVFRLLGGDDEKGRGAPCLCPFRGEERRQVELLERGEYRRPEQRGGERPGGARQPETVGREAVPRPAGIPRRQAQPVAQLTPIVRSAEERRAAPVVEGRDGLDIRAREQWNDATRAPQQLVESFQGLGVGRQESTAERAPLEREPGERIRCLRRDERRAADQTERGGNGVRGYGIRARFAGREGQEPDAPPRQGQVEALEGGPEPDRAVVTRGVGDGEPARQVLEEMHGAIRLEAPPCWLRVVGARGSTGLSEDAEQGGAVGEGQTHVRRFRKRCSRCIGRAPSFSTCRRLALFSSEIHVMPSCR